MTVLLIQISLIIILVAFSAFFSASETALFTISRARLLSYRTDPDPVKRSVSDLMADYHSTLITLILGNMFVNIGISILFDEVIFGIRMNPFLTSAISIFTAVVILLLFGEVAPKTVALLNPEKIAFHVAGKVKFFRFAMSPVVKCTEAVSSKILDLLGRKKSLPMDIEEHWSYIQEGYSAGAFTDKEVEFAKNVFSLRSRTVKSVMKARTDIRCIRKQMGVSEIEEIIIKDALSFYPVTESGTIDESVSILYTKDYFLMTKEERIDWRNSRCVFPAHFIPENTSLIRGLSNMKRLKVPVALVADEYGGVSGIISLKDIYEEVVGDIESEYDFPRWQIKKVARNSWLLSGQAQISEIENITGWTFGDEMPGTVNGIFLEKLDRMPVPGDRIVLEDKTELKVVSTLKNRVEEALMTVHEFDEFKTDSFKISNSGRHDKEDRP